MSESVKKILFKIIGMIPIKVLKKISGVDVLLPYHHLVCDYYAPHIHPLYDFKNEKEFKNDLEYLLKHFKPISPSEIQKVVERGEKLPKNRFLLTFDDGLRETYDIVAPILKEKGIPAIFFLNPAFIDNKDLFFRFKTGLILNEIQKDKCSKNTLKSIESFLSKEVNLSEKNLIQKIKSIDYQRRHLLDDIGLIMEISFDEFLKSYRPYLSSSQIKKMLEDGFHFGAHSIDHPYYKNIDLDEQLYQTIGSSLMVKNIINTDYNFFSFPHLDKRVSESFFDFLFTENKANRFDLIFGNCNQKKDKYSNILHRFNSENPTYDISSLICSVLLYVTINKIRNNNLVRRPINFNKPDVKKLYSKISTQLTA